MIIFSWTLTPNQIVALRCVAEHQRREEENCRKGKWESNPLGGEQIRSWHSSCQVLFRERFIRHYTRPLKKHEKGHLLKEANVWEITEKGRLMLQLVALEIGEQTEVMKLTQRQLKALKQ